MYHSPRSSLLVKALLDFASMGVAFRTAPVVRRACAWATGAARFVGLSPTRPKGVMAYDCAVTGAPRLSMHCGFRPIRAT